MRSEERCAWDGRPQGRIPSSAPPAEFIESPVSTAKHHPFDKSLDVIRTTSRTMPRKASPQ